MHVKASENATVGKPRKRWAIRAIIVLGVYSLLTGGLSCHDRTNFGNESRIDLEKPPLSRIDVQPRETEIHVPLLFHYNGFKRPYRLTMYVFDKNKAFDKIELDEVKLETDDGEVVTGMKDWKRDINESDWYGEGLYGGKLFTTHQVLDVALPRAVPFTITWKGRLRKKGGEPIPFTEKAAYPVRPGFTVIPYWMVLYAYTQL